MPTVTRTNLCTNPSFETGTASWSGGGTSPATLTWSTFSAVDRTHCMQVSWHAVFPSPSYAYTTFATTVGQTYTISAWVYVPSGNPAVGVGADVSHTTTTVDTTTVHDAWQRISATITATATTHTATLGPGMVTGTAYIDAVLIEQAPVVGTYFDGATSGCTWTGTADASTSQQVSGPFTITVSADPTHAPPRFIIFVSGAPLSSVQINRTDPDGAVRPVRGGDPAPVTATQWSGFDYEMPYAGAVTYTAVAADGSGAVSASMPALGVTQPWLVHPGVPALSQPLNHVNLLGTDQSDTGATAHLVLGRENPVIVTDGTRKGETSQIGFRTDSDSDKAAMRSLLADTSSLLLQVVYPFTTASIWRYIAPGRVQRSRMTQQFGDSRRVWVIDVSTVDRPAGGVASQRTWADLIAECATWQDVLNKYATWTGVNTGVAGT